MTAEEMWRGSGLTGEYDAWSFGGDPDELSKLVKEGIKTATCSALCFYELEDEPLPEAGEYSVILDSRDNAVCIIKTTEVYITSFDQVSARHAFKEGEGDRSLDHWREVHRRFFAEELKSIGRAFDEGLQVVCEEFEVVA